MNPHNPTLTALFASSLLVAQEPAPPAAPSAPSAPVATTTKTEAHALLAPLLGRWQTTCKMSAMPEVPGMEAASVWTGTETCEWTCNGLWLASRVEAHSGDERMHGLWLVGYDPARQRYTGLWVSDRDDGCCESTGSFDALAKTFTFEGSSPMGRVRSRMTCNGDLCTETCWLLGADGAEPVQFAEIVRKRLAGAAAIEASSAAEAEVPEALQPLAAQVGTWKATVTRRDPGAAPRIDRATERVSAICDGRWYWTDLTIDGGGAPYEGHALLGWDPAQKRYVGYWIDSGAATAAHLTGDFDAAAKRFTFDGNRGADEAAAIRVHEVCTHTDDQTRTRTVSCTGPDGRSELEISYQRIAR